MSREAELVSCQSLTKQDNLHRILDTAGAENETYSRALEYIRHKTRVEGIDAALRYDDAAGNVTAEYDALLLCDRKGAGQQLAAQAGTYSQVHFDSTLNLV